MRNNDSFLQAKIMSIRTALFFCEDDSTLPFSAYIITALKTDEDNNIWFFLSRSGNKAVVYDRTFPVNLDFYRKGIPFSIAVKGKASLVNNRGLIKDFVQDLLGADIPVKDEAVDGVLLVKVKIGDVHFKGQAIPKPAYSFKNLFSGVKNWWYNPQPRLQPSL